MASDAEAVLKRVLDISKEQTALLEGRRYTELVDLQAERERLLKELPGPGENTGLKPIIDEIIESDAVLSLNIMTVMDDINGKLCRIKNGLKAAKAYSRR